MDVWYPTSVLVTGFDIIFFWVARMIMAGLELFGEGRGRASRTRKSPAGFPFRNVFIHGLIRDEGRGGRCRNRWATPPTRST